MAEATYRLCKTCGEGKPSSEFYGDKHRKDGLRRHPEKYKARTDLNNALRLGKIVKPKHCSGCHQATKSRRLHGHHEDYSRPLDVIWLCQACHTTRHS